MVAVVSRLSKITLLNAAELKGSLASMRGGPLEVRREWKEAVAVAVAVAVVVVVVVVVVVAVA